MMNRLIEVQDELSFQPFGDLPRANVHWNALIPRGGLDS